MAVGSLATFLMAKVSTSEVQKVLMPNEANREALILSAVFLSTYRLGTLTTAFQPNKTSI